MYHKHIDKTENVVYNLIMKNTKYYIDIIIEKEKQRNINMINAYKKRIVDLPKGSLFIREINEKKYCYLRYREGKKVIQKYAGTIEQKEKICSDIAERKRIEQLIAMLEEERKKINKMEMI